MVLTRRNLDWWCERVILVLLVTLLVFAPMAFGAVHTWAFLVVQSLVTCIAVVWLVRLWAGHKPKLLWTPLSWVVVAFVLYAVGRYFTSDIEYVARLELIRVLMYALFFLAVTSNLYDQDSSEIVTYTLTIVAVLASSYAVAQLMHHSNHVWNLLSPYSGRGSGTFINPDHFAAFLELVLPLPLAFLVAGRVGVIARVLLAYAVLTILAGLGVTYSRGGWMAAGAGIAMLLGFLFCHRNHRLRAGLALLVLLAGGGILVATVLAKNPTYYRRVAKASDVDPGVWDFNARLQPWGAAVQMWRDHPVWGVGPGHYDYRFTEYRPEAYQLRPDHAHNDYLELLADWGVVGGVIVLAGIGIFIYGLGRSWPHVRREENDFGSGMSTRYAFFLGAISGLFALAVHSLVDFNLHVTADALVGVVLLGMAGGNLRFATKRYWVRTRLPLQVVLTVIIGGVAFYLCNQIGRRGGEMLWTYRAQRLPAYSDAQAAALQKALAFEPQDSLTVYNIGECYRTQSLDGTDNYAELGQKALTFYEMAIRLNPLDPDSRLRAGMCLDWLGRHSESEKYYSEAESLDPNGDFVVAQVGWHYVQIGDFAAARQWSLRACKLANWDNETAKNYLFEICQPKLMDRASGRIPLQFFGGGKGN